MPGCIMPGCIMPGGIMPGGIMPCCILTGSWYATGAAQELVSLLTDFVCVAGLPGTLGPPAYRWLAPPAKARPNAKDLVQPQLRIFIDGSPAASPLHHREVHPPRALGADAGCSNGLRPVDTK